MESKRERKPKIRQQARKKSPECDEQEEESRSKGERIILGRSRPKAAPLSSFTSVSGLLLSIKKRRRRKKKKTKQRRPPGWFASTQRISSVSRVKTETKKKKKNGKTKFAFYILPPFNIIIKKISTIIYHNRQQ